ncbi:YndM family protein [Cytobacillus sp. S13-E01]|uniref:YndM family protein n=1 Tax=Cytobacillus sp. S13-E01 TaxID=3031326 RepID=UPI0023D87A7C|nr:YndM family protein [Cytobacillus sp. S13-E01]MDF0728083.1 YndM family protein [Cytobacillus sp. S13-E01]
MRHLKALGIKYIVISVVLLSILGIYYNASIAGILMISILVTGVAYVIGDLFILPRFGNLVATFADFGLAFASVWALSLLFIGQADRIVLASLFAATFIAMSEALFHAYMESKVLKKGDNHLTFNSTSFENRFQTEIAEETDIQDIKKEKK